MSHVDWKNLEPGTRTLEGSLVEVAREARAALGEPPTFGDGPFLRWPGASHWLTLSSAGESHVRIAVEPRATAADEEYRDFESLPDDALPYIWRADDIKALPNGSYLPGEREVESFAQLDTILLRTLESLRVAFDALPSKVTDIQMHFWYADPAHAELPKQERWRARRVTAWTLFRKADDVRFSVTPLGGAPVDRQKFDLTSEGVVESGAFLSAQLRAAGAPSPAALRHTSHVSIDRKQWALSPFALGISSMGLWA